MLTRVKEWWVRRKIRREAKEWLGRVPQKNKLRAADKGCWTGEPVFHGWEDRWLHGKNDHPAEKLVQSNLDDLAKDIEEKKKQGLITLSDEKVEFIEHVMLKRENQRKGK